MFESLLANSSSSCRKLHRLAKSVIIVDEAQSLPTNLLAPILDVLRELVEVAGSTVVLSTATQPAFDVIEEFSRVTSREIVPDPGRYFEQLKRVDYEWLVEPKVSWAEIAEVMRSERQALAVLNTKKNALAVAEALRDLGAPNVRYLSTSLCGAHRRRVITDVKAMLASGESCYLAATQLVEAGVDIDFELVARALAPLDALIQAAGRANREGKLRDSTGKLRRGRVVVFDPIDGGTPGPAYSAATGVTLAVVAEGAASGRLAGNKSIDLDDPRWARRYYERLFALDTERGQDIQELRKQLDFTKTDREFRMIKEETETVIITSYGSDQARQSVRRIVDELRKDKTGARDKLRVLQPYAVTVRKHQAERYHRDGLIDEIGEIDERLPGVGEWLGDYDETLGLTGDDPNPDALVI